MRNHNSAIARRSALLVAALMAATVVGCSGSDDAPDASSAPTEPATEETTTTTVDQSGFSATIRRSSDGVPHIVANDLPGVFFGQGYASAQDHGCSLADQMLKITGTRAAALGPGDNDANINSDFAWLSIGINELARADYANASDLVVNQFEAFAAGWSQYLAEVGSAGFSGWCAGADWVRPVSGEDVYAYARSIALNASSSRLTGYIATAQPPATPQPASLNSSADAVASIDEPTMASNGWAVGRDLVEGGEGGILVANPHFPWEGELRFWESHLTVPGELDIYGANLTGVPGIGIGFTSEFAWTHTVSAGNRFTAYTLTLDPADPTTYLVDGQPVAMTSRDFTIDVAGAESVSRTMWSSKHGPILNFPGVGWTDSMVITYRDANINNDEFIEQYAAMDASKSFDEFVEAHRTYQAVPLFNTIAVSRDGRAWYADVSATPNLSAEAEAAYLDQVAAGGIATIGRQSGAVVLDGSTSVNDWEVVDGARDPGLVPWAELPMTERTDYVFNANDSFWVANGSETLSGDYSILHGEQNTARSLRTRENVRILSEDTFRGDDGLFSGIELRDASVGNTSFASHLLIRELAERCSATDTVPSPAITSNDGTTVIAAADVDVTEACATLAAWNGTFDLDAPGAPLFREWLGRVSALGLWSSIWAEPFDKSRPQDTPRGLAPASAITAVPGSEADPVLVALAQAVLVLEAGGREVDVTLGETQFAPRAATRIAVPGGLGSDGVTNVVSWGGLGSSTETVPTRGDRVAPGSTLTTDGYPINYGTSFIMTVDFTGGSPKAWAFLTYSNTGDRSSALFDAQLTAFADRSWREIRFTEDDIDADPDLTEITVSSTPS